MKQEEMVLLMVRGAIAGFPSEQQAKIAECAEKIRALVKEYKEEGEMACGLVAAELVVQK